VAAARPSVLAVLQARMSSSRLPGKVLRPILGRPMLGRHLDRLRRSTRLERLVVATSTDPSDDAVAAFCSVEGVGCHRGSLADVLARYEGALRAQGPAENVVRLTGDCPLADPEIIDRLVDLHVAGGYDYSSNTRVLTFPDGLDAEIMTSAALFEMAAEARDPFEREHVTPFLYRHSERFRLGSLVNDANLGHLRWTVDTEDDFRMVEAVFRGLLSRKPFFGYADTLAFLEANPEIAAINARR
jgi:spore coat polysaccharide biosynthesis protein SpsF